MESNRVTASQTGPVGQDALTVLMLPLLAFVLILGSWTLAYHLCLLTGLAAGWIWAPFGLLVAGGLSLAQPMGLGFERAGLRHRAALLAILGFALAAGSASLFVAYFNPDDVNYFHRALVQLDHLGDPFILDQTGYNESGLPPPSIAHVLTSYELFAAMVAKLLHIDPLYAYHKLGGLAGYCVFVFVYALLYRRFGLAPARAVLATALAFLFCLLDLRVPFGRTYGNVLIALYNGKVLLWGAGIPLLMLLALRYLDRPTPKRLGWVALAGVAAVGMSGTGIFLVPVLLAALSMAYCAANGWSRPRLLRAASLNLGSSYCLLIAAAAFAGMLPRPSDVSLFDIFPTEWWRNLGLVTDRPVILARDVLLLIAAPLLGLSPPGGRLLVAFSLALVMLFANPLAGPVWLQTVTPGAYWRLMYLFPLMFCAGLVGECAIRAFRSTSGRWLRAPLAAALLVWPLYAHLTARHGPGRIWQAVPLASAGGYRLPLDQQAFARLALGHLRGRNVLASNEIFPTLSLLAPHLRFESGRWTTHTFANAGRRAEGNRRELASSVVTYCTTSGPARRAFRISLRRGVDAIVVGPCFASPFPRSRIEALLASEEGSWSNVVSHEGFTLLLRD